MNCTNISSLLKLISRDLYMVVVIIVNPNMISSIPSQKYVIFMYKISKSFVLCNTTGLVYYGFHHKLQFSFYLELENQKEDGKWDFQLCHIKQLCCVHKITDFDFLYIEITYFWLGMLKIIFGLTMITTAIYRSLFWAAIKLL